MELIQITINNKLIYIRPEATILQACEAANVDVPRFCYHEKLSVAGNCRICLVEVAKSPKPVVSCAIPVSKGIVVFSDTPLVRKARESVLEFLLLNHPLDCPICDQGGECDLQDESLTYGSDRGRYFLDFKRSVEDKECGPIVKTIITRCIHCTRCIRFSTEIAGNEIRGSFGRGEETEIGTYVQSFIKTELSGNLVDLCPVGALTSKPYAYKARSWEANRVSTIDLFDTIASDVIAYTRNQSKLGMQSKEQIRAILPMKNGTYFENWISDRTRYAFDSLYISTRFNIKQSNHYSYHVDNLICNFNGNVSSFYLGAQVNLENRYTLDSFSKRILTTNSFTYNQTKYSSNLLNDFPFFYSLNKSVNDFIISPLHNIIRIGTNLRYETSLLNTRLRRESKQRGTNYITLGNFSPLAYPQKHKGNSYRSVIAMLENRITFVKEFIPQSDKAAIYIGVNNLRNVNANFLQQLVLQISKYFFSKNSKNDRLGYIHSSVGSLGFSHISMSNLVAKQDNPNYYYVGINVDSNKNHFSDNVTVFSTHYQKTSKNSKHYAIPSFYESTGHIISIENNVRKHNKVVTPAQPKLYSLETLINYGLAKSLFNYYIWGKSLAKFKGEILHLSYKNETPTFRFNPFSIKNFFINQGKLNTFSQPIKNFYIDNTLASASVTIAECSLFLKQDTNRTNYFNENI